MTAATNSLRFDSDRTMELRRSEVNLLSGTIDDSNCYLNEVGFLILFKKKY